MTFFKNWSKQPPNPYKPPQEVILRSPVPAKMTVEEAVEADRCWFAEHPDEDEYIREFCPGEFGAADLPDIPPGFRYATVVTVIHRTNGVADGRHRRIIAVCDEPQHACRQSCGP
jgi:hypothetical protein